MPRLLLLSDIHGNLSALQAVEKDAFARYPIDGIVLLGDIINYGMRPNETIDEIRRWDIPLFVNLFGNHEKAIMDGDTSRFSTERGKRLLEYTKSKLGPNALAFIQESMSRSGMAEAEFSSKKFLFVHGSLHDPYWGKMEQEIAQNADYARYDFVLCGHSHVPHLTEHFYPVQNPDYRNKKRVVFINPGSVGQPRNHNPRAQYAYFDTDTETIHFNSATYDIESERSLYPSDLDGFYSERLIRGI